jgi:ribosomal-protein-alanine N-acetyltransferase
MRFNVNGFEIAPIHEKDAWRLCNFMVANSERFKNDFPGTLKQNLNPTLSELFVQQKTKQFVSGEEFLFTIKEQKNRTIIGLIYVKELHKVTRQGELAYCIGYEYESKGLTTRFLDQIIPWTYNNIGVETLQIIAHKDNLGSTRIAEKLGFSWKETLSKTHTRFNGLVVDMELYEKYKSASEQS